VLHKFAENLVNWQDWFRVSSQENERSLFDTMLQICSIQTWTCTSSWLTI